jgi:hypothetical protein
MAIQLEGWIRADRPEYKAQLHAFSHANASIARMAREQNLDGVTIGYTQLRISVQCHKIVRDKSELQGRVARGRCLRDSSQSNSDRGGRRFRENVPSPARDTSREAFPRSLARAPLRGVSVRLSVSR